MKSAVENLEPTRVKVTVEAPYDELKQGIDAAYREIANQITVPGFRRGKIPARIIDQRVGRAAVIEQAVNAVLPQLYRDAITENEIKALGSPEVDVTEIPAVTGPLGGQLVFTAEVDIRPEIVIPDLSGVVLEVETSEVTDDDVAERLTSLRERFGTLVGVDRPAQEGDFVVVDLHATIGEEEIESVSGISYEIGSHNMIDGLDEALVGMAVDDEKTFTTRLLAGEHASEDAEVLVRLTAVKERELPEADDEFAELASEFDTIDELLDDLRAKVASDKTANQAVAAREALMVHLRENADFPLPKRIVEDEIKAHLEREGKPEDDPHGEEIREDTEKQLRDQLLLDVLAETFTVEVTQDELLQYLFSASQQFGVDPSEFITSADRNGQIPQFVGEISRTKSLAVALRKVRVLDAAGNAVDLTPFIGQDDEAGAPAEAEKPAKKKAAKKAAKEADGGEPAPEPGDDVATEAAPEATAEDAPAGE